jgi:hypothetical protein
MYFASKVLTISPPESYTPAQRSQHLTQTDPKVFGQYYLANCSSVDGQAAFRGVQSDHRHIEYFQSLERRHEVGLPTTLPARAQAKLDHEPKLLPFKKALQAANTEKTRKDARRCLSNARGCMERETLRKFQVDWLERRQKWKITTRGEELRNDLVKEDLYHGICEAIPERKRLAKLMTSTTGLTLPEKWCAIVDLCSLSSRDDTVLYLPQASPVGESCPSEICQAKLAG